MLIQMMKAKLHGGRVTESNREYSGSLGVDAALLRSAGILPFERVQVLNLDRGQRLETYIIPEQGGSGKLVVNGAAAHHFKEGERILVVAYAWLTPAEAKRLKPVVLILDEANRVKERLIKKMALD